MPFSPGNDWVVDPPGGSPDPAESCRGWKFGGSFEQEDWRSGATSAQIGWLKGGTS